MKRATKRLTMTVVAGGMLAAGVAGAERKVLTPAGAAKPVGPYSPGLEVGDFVYVSGQGVRDGEGKMPEGLEAQARQCLENVRLNLAAAGLGFEHVVAAQLYVEDMAKLPVVEPLWKKAFPAPGPATVRLGTARMPTGTTVEITVVAVKNLAGRKRTRNGVRTGGRTYLDAIYGATRAEVEKKLKKAAQGGVATAYWYATEERAPAVIPIQALPGGAKWAVFAVAGPNPAGGTVYCDAAAAQAGSVEEQTGQAFRQLRACLEAKGASLADLVATNVYLADMDEFARMNAVYARMFSGAFPTRTTVQPGAGIATPRVMISGVAVK